MDNFSCIYKILSSLESALDYDSFDAERISPATLGISQNRWNHYMDMMNDSGLVKGVSIKQYSDGGKIVNATNIQITLNGEYKPYNRNTYPV